MEVRAGFELSYAALDDHVAVAFRRLGLLGPLDFAAWSVSVLTDGDGERLVEHLVNANLLQEAGVDATGEPRYRLHDLPAVYAAELVAKDDPTETRTRSAATPKPCSASPTRPNTTPASTSTCSRCAPSTSTNPPSPTTSPA
ncbi:hypothetical protein [Saccharothrix sp.]|uniref:hypothetical protein n=1 Tax=Saccharothrix sp. TaxID=1873460 RepID=UPI0028110BB0|nr:hypothetical protein [Saccharothrix sp.]